LEKILELICDMLKWKQWENGKIQNLDFIRLKKAVNWKFNQFKYQINTTKINQLIWTVQAAIITILIVIASKKKEREREKNNFTLNENLLEKLYFVREREGERKTSLIIFWIRWKLSFIKRNSQYILWEF